MDIITELFETISEYFIFDNILWCGMCLLISCCQMSVCFLEIYCLNILFGCWFLRDWCRRHDSLYVSPSVACTNFSFQIHKLYLSSNVSLLCTFQTQEYDTYNNVTNIQSKQSVLVCPSKQTSRDQIEKPATKQDVQTMKLFFNKL